MKIELKIESTLNLIKELLDYKIDVAFINGKPKHKELEILNTFEDEIYFIEPKDKEAQNSLLVYRDTCTYCLYLQEYVQDNKIEAYKTIPLQNYELMLGSVKAGYGVSLLSKSIVKKYGYLDKVKLTKIKTPLDTHLVCRKDYLPVIHKYLRDISL